MSSKNFPALNLLVSELDLFLSLRTTGIIHSCFQGELRIDDQAVVKTGEYGSKPKFDLDRGELPFSLDRTEGRVL